MRRAAVALVAGSAAALMLAACSRAPEAVPVLPPADGASSVDCLAEWEVGHGSVPADFVPVSVWVCDPLLALGEPETIENPPLELADPDDLDLEGATPPAPETDPAPVEPQRMDGDIDALLAAFAEPSDPKWLGPCTAIGVIVPDVWLVDADGAAVRPAYPADGCGIPKAGVGAVLAEFSPVG